MTSTDLFGTTEADPDIAVKALGDILSFFHGEAMGSPISQGIGDTQATTTTTTTPGTSESGTTGEATSSPVPKGTPINGAYGEDRPGGGHPGVDLGVPVGSQILAANTGTVTHAANDDPGGYGQWVEITGDDGIVTRYGHLSGMTVAQGTRIRAGQVIGQSGGAKGAPGAGNSTGAHLHFEVRQGGHTIDPTPLLAGGYQVVGGVSADTTTTTTADPQALAAIQLQNVVNVMGGKPLIEDTPTTSTTSTQSATGGADDDPGAVDSFLAATRQHESGGDYTIRNTSGLSNAAGAYQFIGSTWKGLGGSTASAADASPAEQDRIAKAYAQQLFNQFHSWRLVAIAWYGGPGVAEQVARGQDPGSPEGQGPYLAYGDTIAKMMSGGK